MTRNIGTIDRIARLILGIVFLTAPFITSVALFQSTAAIIVSVLVGVVMFGTSVLKFCPLYRLFGLRTCRV